MVPLLGKFSARFLAVCMMIVGLQILVGLLGFALHGVAVIGASGPGLFDRIAHGAPLFAPLLFVNLAFLSGLGLWDVQSKRTCRS